MVAAVIVRDAAPPKAEEKPYVPHGGARLLMLARDREVLLAGPAGTGKSRACLEKVNLILTLVPGARGFVARKTRRSLTQTAMVTFEEHVLARGAAYFHHGDQEYRYRNGSRLIVIGCDDPDKMGSLEVDVGYVQEATELDAADWSMLVRGLRYGRAPVQQLIADCNPADPQHWLKQRCDAGVTRLIESRHEDNPTVTPEYLAGLDGLEMTDPVRYKRLRLGLWVAADGQFFGEWNPELHVCEPFAVPEDWTRWLAVDYGFADPFCCLWFARSPDRKRIVVYRELYAPELRDEQQAALVAARSKGERIVRRIGDPSMFNQRREQNKPSIAEVYERAGVPLEAGFNSRVQGWAVVRRALAWKMERGEVVQPPRLQVMRDRCPNLVRTLPAMVRDPLDAEDLADKIRGRKTEDHAVDALRYGLALEAMAPRPGRARVQVGG